MRAKLSACIVSHTLSRRSNGIASNSSFPPRSWRSPESSMMLNKGSGETRTRPMFPLFRRQLRVHGTSSVIPVIPSNCDLEVEVLTITAPPPPFPRLSSRNVCPSLQAQNSALTKILSPLGAGGIDKVYRARDSRLDRLVAIKVLPEHLSQDPHLRHRLETKLVLSPSSLIPISAPCTTSAIIAA